MNQNGYFNNGYGMGMPNTLNNQPFGNSSYPMPSTPNTNQPASLSGRIITQNENIIPQEVSMDGTPSFFPAQDGSAIYVKQWAPDGSRIMTTKFVPENIPESTNKSTEQIIMENLVEIKKDIIELKKQARYNRKGGYKNGHQGFSKSDSSETSRGTE